MKNVSRALSGFTLVELLVSIAVLVLIVALVSQLTNSATTATTASGKRLDADGQARLAFSRMANDFAGMINRKDVDCFFVKNSGGGTVGHSDAMYFHTDGAGYFGTASGYYTPMSFVGYRIANHQFTTAPYPALYPDNVLERIGVGDIYVSYNNSVPKGKQLTFLAYSGTTPDVQSTLPSTHGSYMCDVSGTGSAKTSPYYWDGLIAEANVAASIGNYSSVLCDSVFRMEFCFQVKDPTKYNGYSFVVPVAPGATPGSNQDFAGPTTAQTSSTGAPCITMRKIYSDVAAVVVTIAVLDAKSRVIATSQMISDAASALPDGDDPTVAASWIALINDSSSNGFKAKSKLPQTAASQVRVYQRFFPLNR